MISTNFKAIIFACDDDELKVILDAMLLRNKRLLCDFVQEHPDLTEAPTEAPKKEDPPELTEEEKTLIDDVVYGIIRTLATEKIGVPLEDVIKECMALDYRREDISQSLDRNLDKGNIYEPDIGFLNYVNY